jgi:hypothetical protein
MCVLPSAASHEVDGTPPKFSGAVSLATQDHLLFNSAPDAPHLKSRDTPSASFARRLRCRFEKPQNAGRDIYRNGTTTIAFPFPEDRLGGNHNDYPSVQLTGGDWILSVPRTRPRSERSFILPALHSITTFCIQSPRLFQAGMRLKSVVSFIHMTPQHPASLGNNMR